ncbi:MAG: hypothetical protein J7507_12460 [Pseudoxanthomonas sp.]|nr:hypothetical protein [Pseudoxanthomonas sp.]
MTPLFRKLNLGAHARVCVLDAPASFEPELAALASAGVAVERTASATCGFALAFAITCAQRDAASATLAQTCPGDAVLWLAYPKGTSKRSRGEFNRDGGWDVLGTAGFEPVRQVAIDEDWSALRFRRTEYIRTMTRHPEGRISAAGRRRATEG